MTILFTFPAQQSLATSLLAKTHMTQGNWEWRHFPDGESYVRVASDVKNQPTVILCSLDRPDEKTMALIYLADTLQELGASKVTLVAPYLGYMRQDKRFHDGEAVTSTIYAQLLSARIDKIVTIDPHLHRHKNLGEIYNCECEVLTAAPLMAQWMTAHVQKPLIVGPDMESEQWVKDVAARAHAQHIILEKTRHGDREVDIVLPTIESFKDRTPVLIDDIISSAATMIKTIELLRKKNYGQVVCIATHGIFADAAFENLLRIGNVKIITANTIPHPSNALDVASLLIMP